MLCVYYYFFTNGYNLENETLNAKPTFIPNISHSF